MEKDQKAKKPKVQKPKADKVETEKRVRIVQEWLIDDWSTDDIVLQIKLKWGVDWRQAKRYITAARKRWQKKEEERIDSKRRRKITKLEKLSRSLTDTYKGSPSGITAVLGVEKYINELEGFHGKKASGSGKDGTGATANDNTKVILLLPINGRELKYKANGRKNN